jgi:hypothetical protein
VAALATAVDKAGALKVGHEFADFGRHADKVSHCLFLRLVGALALLALVGVEPALA